MWNQNIPLDRKYQIFSAMFSINVYKENITEVIHKNSLTCLRYAVTHEIIYRACKNLLNNKQFNLDTNL